MAFERIWFTSDQHFNHKRIIEYTGRPFDSVEEMNERLINNWNKAIGKEDRVFVLGDFALCGKDKIIEIGQRLKGRKILILGNHDGASLKTYYEAGFEMVSRFPLFWNGLLLSHEPIERAQYPNIHGHIHQKIVDECDYELGDVLYVNVCVDRTMFKPLSYDSVKGVLNVWI